MTETGESAAPADDGYECAAALFGAACGDAAWVADVALQPVTWEQWAFLEKTDVVTEMAAPWILSAATTGLEVTVHPPPCLAMIASTLDEWERCAERMGTVVLALRLAGARSFLDPALTLSAAVRGPYINRRVGAYRMFGYSCLVDPPDVLDADRVAETSRLVGLIDSRGAHELLRPVRSMCAPMLPPNATVLIALQLIEGIYGPMSQPINGLSFAERLVRADVPAAHVAWMSGDADDSGRATRNAVAHGRAVSEAAADRLADFACAATRAFLDVEPDAPGADPVTRFRNTVWNG